MQMDNEYVKILELYMEIVDRLLDGNLCAWTKADAYANFKVTAFRVLLKQKGRGDNYRYYMRIFRTFGWIICKTEKFSNVQWINGKSIRVVSVDYEKYKFLKELTTQKCYAEILEKYLKVVDKLIYLNEKKEKRLCIYSKDEKLLKVKGDNFKILLEKDCNGEQQNYMRIFRTLDWIICDEGKFSNVQKIDGKPTRVISIDFEKYKLMKELLKN